MITKKMLLHLEQRLTVPIENRHVDAIVYPGDINIKWIYVHRISRAIYSLQEKYAVRICRNIGYSPILYETIVRGRESAITLIKEFDFEMYEIAMAIFSDHSIACKIALGGNYGKQD